MAFSLCDRRASHALVARYDHLLRPLEPRDPETVARFDEARARLRAATTRPERPSPQLTIDDVLDKETGQWP